MNAWKEFGEAILAMPFDERYAGNLEVALGDLMGAFNKGNFEEEFWTILAEKLLDENA